MKLALPEIPPLIQATVRSRRRVRRSCRLVRAARHVAAATRDGTLAAGLAAGVLFGVEFLLIFPGLHFTAASRAALFIYHAPFFVALGARLFLPGDRFAPAQWLGLALSFAGLVVAFGVPTPARRSAAADRRPHDGRRRRCLGRDHAGHQGERAHSASRPRRCCSISSVVSVPILALGALAHGRAHDRHAVGASALGWLAYQTFWVVSLTFAVWFALMQRYSASRLSAFTFLTPAVRRRGRPFGAGRTACAGFRAAVALVAAGLVLVNRPRLTGAEACRRR